MEAKITLIFDHHGLGEGCTANCLKQALQFTHLHVQVIWGWKFQLRVKVLFNWGAVSYQLAFQAVRILQSVHDALDLKTAVEASHQTNEIRKYVIQEVKG